MVNRNAVKRGQECCALTRSKQTRQQDLVGNSVSCTQDRHETDTRTGMLFFGNRNPIWANRNAVANRGNRRNDLELGINVRDSKFEQRAGAGTIAAAAAYHTHSTSVVSMALLRMCHAHVDIDACERRQAIAMSGQEDEAALAVLSPANGGYDAIRLMGITMGGLDRSIQALIMVVCGAALAGRDNSDGSGLDGECRGVATTVVGAAGACVEFGFEMGDDRSRMKMGSSAAVINVGLRPRRIWNVLIVVVVMNGSDWCDDGPTMVGFRQQEACLQRRDSLIVDGSRLDG
ncbi:hypothetical protein ACLOJK_024100 [Asimina triloba]